MILKKLMKENSECRVLVLTPTNKSADVLVKRIMDVSGEDSSYEDWLVRFGGTGDEELEQSPIFRDKTFLRTLSKSVTVTTIARFPYDFFMPQGSRAFLHGMNWDYIIIDEASILFTFEYVSCLSRAIAKNNPGSLFKVGIIAPYRAQADMIDKLLASELLPPEVDVQVGTIYGFQGDECDLVFAVFNTPPRISNSREMFLNRQNIVNVAISRAKDYLFVVMPDDETEGISNLRLVKRVEDLIHATGLWNEFASQDLEDLMFDDPHYLENNTFSTSHQSVNVYGLPEKCYEVRTEENAVDIQIHRPVTTAIPEENR